MVRQPRLEVLLPIASGFGDQSHFQKIFRRRFGTTPGRFRRDPEAASGRG